METTQEQNLPAVDPDVVPHELARRRQWVVWRLEKRGDKPTKVPYTPHAGIRADTTDPDTWGSLAEALKAHETGGYDGLGFVFGAEDPFAGIDLDHVRDPNTGAVAEWATEWVEAFGSYAEVSPSGAGLHIIVRGNAPNRKNQKAGTEAYSKARFFTFTGDVLDGFAGRGLPERQDVLDRFCEKFFPTTRHASPKPTGERRPVDLEDEELLQKARTARGGVGERFVALYDRGELLDHASHSEARLELLKYLAFWTAWDAPRMSALYEGSALYATPGYAKKWARLGERECRLAIDATPRAYRQEARYSREPGGELAGAVGSLRAEAAAMAWEGRSGPTDRATYGAALDVAAKYGTVAKTGIVVAADLRTLAVKAGTSHKRVGISMTRLREDRGLVRLLKKGTGRSPAVYLLLFPKDPQGGYIKQCEDYVPPLSEQLRQFRNRGPTTEKEFDKNGRKIVQDTRYLLTRLGKLVALVTERVAVAGESGVTLSELACSLGRRPDNVRRPLVKALHAGLVVEGEDLRFRAPRDLAWRLETELQESGCNDARDRDVRRYAAERREYYARLRGDHRADTAPSAEDLEREGLQRVQDALDVLQTPGTGPAMILYSYLSGETRTFGYVVNAVAFYYGCADAALWRVSVERAVELIAGSCDMDRGKA